MNIIPNNEWIKTDEDPILRKKLNELTFPLSKTDGEYLEKMINYIDSTYEGNNEKYHTKPGVAIAANQVGWNKRVIYLHFIYEHEEFRYLLANPKVISFSQGFCYLSDGEGCLSVEKKVDGFVPRRMKILIEAIDMNNENKKIKLSAHGFLAIALQHEIDHLNGILYYDHINKEDPFFVDEDWSVVE